MTPNAAWDGVSDTVLVTAQPIAAATSGSTTVRTFTVTLVVAIDPTITLASSNCIAEPGELGTGLANTATLTVNGVPDEASDCAEVPVNRMDKELVDVVPNGDGTYTLSYLITVQRFGPPGTYDVTDELMLGGSVTVTSIVAANVTPGGVSINPAFDGETDTLVADDVPILAGATHTYTLTVVADVDVDLVTTENANCTLTGAETGTGAMNRAAMEIDDTDYEDTACQPFPAISTDKEVTPARRRSATASTRSSTR